MGKKKGNKDLKELWAHKVHASRASKAILSDILEFIKDEEYRLFKGKQKPREDMVKNISEALASCYIKAEERKDAFWLRVRTLEGVPSDKALSYDDDKNLITWA